MLPLEFDYLKVEGFKSFIGTTIIDFRKHGVGLHFLAGMNLRAKEQLGSNGAGKSTLWDALVWCLQGRTARGLRNPDVRPWHPNGCKTKVEVGYRTSDHAHVCVRTIAPNFLTLDGKACDQRELDRSLGLTFDLLTHTVVLGQGRPLFFDLEPRRKMELFGTTLNLDRWDVRSQFAAEKVAKLEQRLIAVQHDIDSYTAKIDQMESLMADTAVSMSKWSVERHEAVKHVEAELAQTKVIYQNMERDRGEWDLKYDGAMTELQPLEAQLRDVDRQYQHALAKCFAIRDAIESPDKCPTCGQKIVGHAEHVRRLTMEQRTAEAKKNKHLEVVQRLKKSHAEFAKKANDSKHQLDYYTARRAEAAAKVQVLEDRMGEVSANPFRTQLREYQATSARYAADRLELRRKRKQIRRAIERRAFWVKAFRDVRLEIVQTVLQELEMVTASLLEQIGLLGWRVNYAIEKETQSGTVQRGLTVLILSPDNDKPVKWEVWSGGEQQRLRIVSALALSQVLLSHAGVAPNLEVLDEPTSHMSPQGTQYVCDFLADRAHQLRKCIIYADQNVVESTRFTSTIYVVKGKAGSRLREHA